MSIFQSVYSQIAARKTFWQTDEFPQYHTNGKPHILEGRLSFFYNNEWKERQLVKLSKSSMYFSEASGVLVWLKIKWCLVTSFSEEKNSGDLYGFTLSLETNIKQDFYTENSEALDQWLSILSQVSIMTNIQQDYVIIKEIDSGKFGTVYLCQDINTHEEYAMKKILKKDLINAKYLNQIFNEIAILRKLDHKSIIKLYKVYEEKKYISLILEYIPYGNMLKRILKKKKLTEKQVMIFSRNLFEVLAYIHSKGIIHRDLKLENILMTSNTGNSEFKLADFGLACYIDKSLKSKSGSPGYMAPEILRGNTYSTKVDVFSAGIIIFILLTGTSPFVANTTQKIIEKNLKCRICFEGNECKSMSRHATSFIIEILTSEPTYRPTAQQVLKHPWIKYKSCSDSELASSSPYTSAGKLFGEVGGLIWDIKLEN
ncbi:hypothetical protein SteCoe_31124 [Stentor coeruleus]|uniref:Protein kinase domain-containing protein n=1 Tax=Stentor coeruleus TaxID=5963 RepID=A0A1R2B216_9CILI|nr:hypothetical protein SteCoe_31124 [Stentor coeruleus]